MLKHFHFACFCALALIVLVHAQGQTGFISLDCGIPAGSSYTDLKTGLKYVSDAAFIDTGESESVPAKYKTNTLDQQFLNLRSFPDGKKNCYTLQPAQAAGNKYLIRARFLYSNYDQNSSVTRFDLYLGANKWDTVKLINESMTMTMEIIHIPSSNYIFVCLVKTGYGTPFISALELRPLPNSTYRSPYASLVLYNRLDVGSATNDTIRYKDDVYDRIWWPLTFLNSRLLSTSLTIDADSHTSFYPPSSVMETANTPTNLSGNLGFQWQPDNPASKYYIYMYFAEVEQLLENQTRVINITENGVKFTDPISPNYLYSTVAYSQYPVSGDKIEYSISKTNNSTLPPILNGLEIYMALETTLPQTDDQDVTAMMNIKSKYGLKRNWQGDPCTPEDYLWEGLNCSYSDNSGPLRVISLDLSSSILFGKIDSSLSGLAMLKTLDLSNNNLTGLVPDFLSQLQFLQVLDLRGNNLTGPLPADLLQRSNSKSLTLSVDDDLKVCSTDSCKTKNNNKKKKNLVPVVGSVSAALALLITLIVLTLCLKRRKKGTVKNAKPLKKLGSLEPKNHQFSYSEILIMTNNFERVIGKGGFGTVYHGYLNDTPVAVKMLSPTSAQGNKEFQAEVKLLLRVHHRNLTSLVGYCSEETHIGLIYEYMANGNLARHLSETSAFVLSWEERLRIAMDAAQGLEYLHNGCKPPIIHRDVKPSNILLNDRFQAKLADFGLSRIIPAEDGGHVSTVVAGTPGYLDPEYYVSNWLNEKSDVYSFGVVLLEIITSRKALVKTEDRSHIVEWVSNMLQKGEIKDIVDPRLQGDFNTNSAWKAVEIAMSCVSPTSAKRPTMINVVMDLKECLALEVARRGIIDGCDTESKDSIELISMHVDAPLSSPLAR